MTRVMATGTLVAVALVIGGAAEVQPAWAGQAPDVSAFVFDPSWPKPLPHNWILGNVVGVAVDTRDHIWVLHRPGTLSDFERAAALDPPRAVCCRPAPPVIEFDQEGNVVQAWGGPGAGHEWPLADRRPPAAAYLSPIPIGEHGIFVDHADHVWIGGNGGTATHILKFSRTGEFLLQIGRRGQSDGSNDTQNLRGPAGLTVDPDTNEVYVADGYGNRRVIVFDADTGDYRRHWGAYGSRPDDDATDRYVPDGPPPRQFNTVHCVRIGRDGLVYVCDRDNNRIQVFHKDGGFVTETVVAPHTLPGPGSVQDIGFSPDDDQRWVYVADGTNAKVWILRRDGLQVVGSFGRGGHFAGGFTMAHSMAVDSQGALYIGETLEGKRVQRFVPK